MEMDDSKEESVPVPAQRPGLRKWQHRAESRKRRKEDSSQAVPENRFFRLQNESSSFQTPERSVPVSGAGNPGRASTEQEIPAEYSKYSGMACGIKEERHEVCD